MKIKLIIFLLGIIVGIGIFFHNQIKITHKIASLGDELKQKQYQQNLAFLKEKSIEKLRLQGINKKENLDIQKIIIYNYEDSFQKFYKKLLKNDKFVSIMNKSNYKKSELKKKIDSLKENLVVSEIHIKGFEGLPVIIKNIPEGIKCDDFDDLICIHNSDFNIKKQSFKNKNILLKEINRDFSNKEIVKIITGNYKSFYDFLNKKR